MSIIKAVFLDFYGTLVHWSPAAEAIQAQACAAEGLALSETALAEGYEVANAYMAQENALMPMSARPVAERRAFFAEYERRLLGAAGAMVSLGQAARIWERVNGTPKELVLYGDARPALEGLVTAGLTTGVISNMDSKQMEAAIRRLGLNGLVHHWVTSTEAGVSKPHPAIFEAALAQALAEPHEAVHVGDDYDGDVVGARKARLHALWLLRKGPSNVEHGPVIRSLQDVLPHLREHGLLGAG